MIKQMKVNGYTLQRVIGRGSFGKVYLSSTGEAVKQINIDGLNQYLLKSLKTEINLLANINHPNIVRLKQSFYVKQKAYIVMEYCPEDLKMFLSKKNGRVSEKEALNILKQLVEGFRELVKRSIIHRDLKPANILVRIGEDGEPCFKLADFGFAKYVDEYQDKMLQSIVGTPLYMAPQILNKQSYSTKCDIWSLGLIFYEMLTGLLPWSGSNQAQLLNNIKYQRLLIPSDISDFSKNILKITLSKNQSSRASWDDIFHLFPQQKVGITLYSSSNFLLNKLSRQNSRQRSSKQRKDQSPIIVRKKMFSMKRIGQGQKQLVSPDIKYIKLTTNNDCRNRHRQYCSPAFIPKYQQTPNIPVSPKIQPPQNLNTSHKKYSHCTTNTKENDQNELNLVKGRQKFLCEVFENQFRKAYGENQLSNLVKNMKGLRFYRKDEVIRALNILKPFNLGFQSFIKKAYKIPPISQ